MEKGPPITVLDVCEKHRVGRICTYHGTFRFPAGCRISTGLRDRGGLMIFVLLSLLASGLGSMHTDFTSKFHC
jgi:hypothetical protein